MPSAPRRSSTNTSGTARDTSLSQYWKAWTKVIERMPPESTVTHTTVMTSPAPTQPGAPAAIPSASAAPCSCGTMYSQPTTTTRAPVVVRVIRPPRRICAKSGSV